MNTKTINSNLPSVDIEGSLSSYLTQRYFLKKTKKIKNGRKQNEKYKNFLTHKNLKNYAIGKYMETGT